MARWKFGIGEFFETLTKNELDDSLASNRHALAEAERTLARGVKYMRFNPPVTGQAVSGKLTMGGDYVTGPAASGGASIGGQAGAPSPQPRSGYAWLMRRMSVTGLTTGSTPDVVNLFRHASDAVAYTAGGNVGSAGEWQFNGNNFAYTFSFGELIFLEGETPILVNQGTFASTALISLRADFVETPQELLWKALS